MVIPDAALEALASRITVTPQEFGRTFTRAQLDRDEVVDLAAVAALDPGASEILACLRYAVTHGFAKRLLRKAIEAQVAGALLSPNGKAFDALCAEHAGVKATIDITATLHMVEKIAADPDYQQQAISPNGFEANVAFLSAQLQNVMRTVCRITSQRYAISGSGVLIAPHLVATAAHVLDPLRDENGGFYPDAADDLKIRLEAIVPHDSGTDRSIAVAGQWLVEEACCTIKPDAAGKLTLPDPAQLVDSHDVAILQLSTAPGLMRGWTSLEGAGFATPERRPGLLLHHHPGGADQMVSYGARQGGHGSRFLHSCSSLGGSSGGPLISPAAKLVGLHHGGLLNSDPVCNVGGGGDWLAKWWRDNPDKHQPDPALNPLWEWRASGRPGAGTPIIGFDGLQQDIWKAQTVAEPMVAVASLSPFAGRLLTDFVPAMLPPGGASVFVIRHAELDSIADHTLDAPEPVSAVLERLAAQLRLPLPPTAPPGTTPVVDASDLSTDAVQAAAMVGRLAERFKRVQSAGPIWLLVQLEDRPLLTAVSEALGHLYRALLSVEGGRGRLLLIGEDPALPGAMENLLRGSSTSPVRRWSMEQANLTNITRYLTRWCQIVLKDRPELHAGFIMGVRAFVLTLVENAAADCPDAYASLNDVITTHLAQFVKGRA